MLYFTFMLVIGLFLSDCCLRCVAEYWEIHFGTHAEVTSWLMIKEWQEYQQQTATKPPRICEHNQGEKAQYLPDQICYSTSPIPTSKQSAQEE